MQQWFGWQRRGTDWISGRMRCVENKWKRGSGRGDSEREARGPWVDESVWRKGRD
jgi:hypothetical protein